MDKVEREKAQQEMSARQTDGSKRVRDKDLYGSHFQLATPPVVESGQGDNGQPASEGEFFAGTGRNQAKDAQH